jgi:hypothetical protein
VSCTDIRKFCELFHYLDLSGLSALVECHQIKETDSTRGSKMMGINQHACSPSCPGYSNVLIFRCLNNRRKSVHTPTVAGSLHIVFDNWEVSISETDVSTFTLNASYDFIGMDSPSNFDGHVLTCTCDEISKFVSYYTQLTMAHLSHCMPIVSRSCPENRSWSKSQWGTGARTNFLGRHIV